MSHHYRCSRCRTRNVWPKAFSEYKHGRRCKHCGYERFYVDKERVNRKPCKCDGGLLTGRGSIPHRPGSPCCIHHPRFEFNRAIREGMDPHEAAFIGLGAIRSEPGAECPF